MKRFFAALLTLTCMLSLSACREEQAAAKPVIYLSPEEETACLLYTSPSPRDA